MKYIQYTSNYDQVKNVEDQEIIPEPELGVLMKPDPDIMSGKIPSKADTHTVFKLKLGYLRVSGLRDEELEADVASARDPRAALDYVRAVKQAIPALTDIIMEIPDSGAGVEGLLDALHGSGRPLPERLKGQILEHLKSEKPLIHRHDVFFGVIECEKQRWLEGEQAIHLWDTIGANTRQGGMLNTMLKYCVLVKQCLPEFAQIVLSDTSTKKRACPTHRGVYSPAHWLVKSVVEFSKQRIRIPKAFFKAILANCVDEDITNVVQATGNRWPDAEPLLRTPDGVKRYYVATGYMVPQSEGVILASGDARQVYVWMEKTGHWDWPEAEAIIANDKMCVGKYIRKTGRRPCSKDIPADTMTPITCYNYAKIVGDDKFLEKYPDGESIILQDLDVALDYAANIVGPIWDELVEELDKRGTPEQQARYRKMVGDDPFASDLS